MATAVPVIAVRGSTGITIHNGPPNYKLVEGFQKDISKSCRCMLFSPEGKYFAWANGKHVTIVTTSNWEVVAEIEKPRVCCMQFSPKGTFLMTWESYKAPAENQTQFLNMHVFRSENGEVLASFEQKKQIGWALNWSRDEVYCSRLHKNDVLFYKSNDFSTVAEKIQNQRVHTYSVSPSGMPFNILCYIPGKQGQPSLVKMYQFPRFDTPVANKSFFQADSVEIFWNKKGTEVLFLTNTDIDKTGTSYYGKSALHFMSSNGETSMVQLGKEGSVFAAEWSPNSQEFCVVYGSMPAKATLFNLKCEPIFHFGTGPRNSLYFNPHGNILILGGFGNLAGYVELWELPAKKLINKFNIHDVTLLSWSPDGVHFLTATTAPRLRVSNGFKVHHYSGTLLYERPWNQQEELWEVAWQNFPENTFKKVEVVHKAVDGISPITATASKEVYRPPAARGKASTFKLHEDELPCAGNQIPGSPQSSQPSKAALKQKKKREAKKAAKAQATDEDLPPTPAPKPNPESNGIKAHLEEYKTDDPVKMKKIMRLRSKVMEIERLKDLQKTGKQLEANQLDKIKKEDQILQEMRDLAL